MVFVHYRSTTSQVRYFNTDHGRFNRVNISGTGFFYRVSPHFKTEDIPVVAFSVGEEELSGFDTTPLVGHLAAWNYFMSAESDANDAFIESWHEFTGDDSRVTNDPMEATYIGFEMWADAVEKAGTTRNYRGLFTR